MEMIQDLLNPTADNLVRRLAEGVRGGARESVWGYKKGSYSAGRSGTIRGWACAYMRAQQEKP